MTVRDSANIRCRVVGLPAGHGWGSGRPQSASSVTRRSEQHCFRPADSLRDTQAREVLASVLDGHQIGGKFDIHGM